MISLTARPLTATAFAPFGDVLECAGAPDKIINQGKCGRYHDRAALDFGADGRAGISLFHAQARSLPYVLNMVERHPDGSQAFIPMNAIPMLITVAQDINGQPANFCAFLSGPGQAINLHRGVWHGVLAPIGADGTYAVVDRIGPGANLQEHWLDEEITIVVDN